MGKKTIEKKGHDDPPTLREANPSEAELPLSAENGAKLHVDVEKKKKKKNKKKKRHEASGDDVELSDCENEPVIKDNVDGDIIVQKNEMQRENGGLDTNSSVRQSKAVGVSNVGKDKRKKKNKKLQEDSGNAVTYSVDKNDLVVEGDAHMDKKKKSENRQMDVEEVDRKKKKKHKREKGGDHFSKENDATDVEAGKDREQSVKKTMENVDNSRKKKKRNKNHSDGVTTENHTQNDVKGSVDQNDLVVEGDKKKKSKDRQLNWEEVDRKKKKKRKREKGGDHLTEVNDATGVDTSKKKKKRKKKHSDGVTAENHTQKEAPKKVSFSDEVEVFPPPDGSVRDGSVRGKRFSAEENEMIKNAVYDYIERHGLGEDGLNMVLHCNTHPKIRKCWKEIASALPWRPQMSIYYRAHCIFERDENRNWSREELELVRKFHEKHGSDWKMLANALGKHRVHVKDAWRRIKFPNLKKGHWSQDEYQNLFDLVNLDLCMRASEEKKTKHGMLRDNISWEAISEKLETRTNALCCQKWYNQLTSPLVAEGKWSDTDDYHLVTALYGFDACCADDVDWDNLLEHRSGSVCKKRWGQMVKHLGRYGNKSFAEMVEILYQRYCPEVLEAREAYNSAPAIDEEV